jgi:hypothetical protein
MASAVRTGGAEVKTLWILVTGARDLRDSVRAREMIRTEFLRVLETRTNREVMLVHGDAPGIDTIAKETAIELGIKHEPWSAEHFYSPLVRNKFMVNLVAELKQQGDDVVCWAFARKWASGTGNCAREARRRGLEVIDYGVSTEDPNNPF